MRHRSSGRKCIVSEDVLAVRSKGAKFTGTICALQLQRHSLCFPVRIDNFPLVDTPHESFRMSRGLVTMGGYFVAFSSSKPGIKQQYIYSIAFPTAARETYCSASSNGQSTAIDMRRYCLPTIMNGCFCSSERAWLLVFNVSPPSLTFILESTN